MTPHGGKVGRARSMPLGGKRSERKTLWSMRYRDRIESINSAERAFRRRWRLKDYHSDDGWLTPEEFFDAWGVEWCGCGGSLRAGAAMTICDQHPGYYRVATMRR
jgi:hypothetical protein